MSSDDTPRWGSGPGVFLEDATRIRIQARAKIDRLEQLEAQAEVLEVGFASWNTTPVPATERAREINALMNLREAARKEGVIE